ncbi:MAG: flagellar filament capping protein FliD, partial [Betaproteobacteria bacterium]
LRSALSTVPSGVSSTYQGLSALGINSQLDGSLKLDSTALQTAIDTNFSAVATTLSAYGTVFDSLTTGMNASEGLITSHTSGITDTSKRLSDRIDSMNLNLVQVEARYRKQYTALDTLMGKLSTTSSYLTQQLASLNKSSN